MDKAGKGQQTAQVENLKKILKGFGIRTSAELDAALSDALDAMTIGIMTDVPAPIKNTA